MSTRGSSINVVERWLSARIADLSFDEHGVAAIKRDDETLVVIEIADDGVICHLYGPVCRPPDEMPEIALITALELNRFGRPLGGCWLAWDSDVSMFSLCYNLRIPDNDEQMFNNTLDRFIQAWVQLICTALNYSRLLSNFLEWVEYPQCTAKL